MIVSFIVSAIVGLVAVAWYVLLCVRYALCVEYVKGHYKWQEIPSAEMLRAVYERLGDRDFDHQFVRCGESRLVICFPTYETVSHKNGWRRYILILPSWLEYRKFMRWEKNWKFEQEIRAEVENKNGNRSDEVLRDMSRKLEQKSQSGGETEDLLKARDKIMEMLAIPGTTKIRR